MFSGMTPEEAFKKLVDNVDVYDESLNLTKEEILEMGMRVWGPEELDGEKTGRTLWLFPVSYYEYIPAGFPIVCIDWSRKVFNPHITDNDTRFGMMAFGVLARPKAA